MQYDHILKNVDFIQAYVTPAVGHFWPKGHNFNTFGRGDATYQISRLLALWFQKGNFFQVLPVKACVNHVTTEKGTFLAQGVYLEQS